MIRSTVATAVLLALTVSVVTDASARCPGQYGVEIKDLKLDGTVLKGGEWYAMFHTDLPDQDNGQENCPGKIQFTARIGDKIYDGEIKEIGSGLVVFIQFAEFSPTGKEREIVLKPGKKQSASEDGA